MIELDVRIFRALQEAFGGPSWLAVMSALTVLGSGWGSLLVLPLFASTKTRRFASILACVLVGTAPITFTLKLLVRRPRPFMTLDGVRALVFEAPTDFSFPSGHASGSFAFATFTALVLLRGGGARVSLAAGVAPAPLVASVVPPPFVRGVRRVFAVLLLAAAAGVGLSRVVLGVHYPGDVLVGSLLGISTGAFGAFAYRRPELFRRRRGDGAQVRTPDSGA